MPLAQQLKDTIGKSLSGTIKLRVGIVVDTNTVTTVGTYLTNLGHAAARAFGADILQNHARVNLAVLDEQGVWSDVMQVPIMLAAIPEKEPWTNIFGALFNCGVVKEGTLAIVAFMGDNRTTDNAIVVGFFDPNFFYQSRDAQEQPATAQSNAPASSMAGTSNTP